MNTNPYFNQSINCLVHNCMHCDITNNKCQLSEIKVCNHHEEKSKKDTMCDNFIDRY